MELSLMRQFKAMAASVANSTAFLLRTGSAPGIPRQTGQTLVFGGVPNLVEQEQKILVAVRSWTCTSSPITGSNFGWAAIEVSAVVAIEESIIKGAKLSGTRNEGKPPSLVSLSVLGGERS